MIWLASGATTKRSDGCTSSSIAARSGAKCAMRARRRAIVASLAVRNQFFTPRYVVRFLVDNTLARSWWQMRGGDTQLTETCEFLVLDNAGELTRQKKDPREIKILDPACGSGHFLLYAFDLLQTIYEEAWHDDRSPPSLGTGSTLKQDYDELDDLRHALPALILANNLYGVEIDPRAAQIAALALWLRAQRAYREYRMPAAERSRITRTHIVVAEPMPGDRALMETFADDLQPPLLGDLFRRMTAEMRLAGELGTLLRVDDAIATTLRRTAGVIRSTRDDAAPPRPTAGARAGGAGLQRDRRRAVLRGGGGDPPQRAPPLL